VTLEDGGDWRIISGDVQVLVGEVSCAAGRIGCRGEAVLKLLLQKEGDASLPVVSYRKLPIDHTFDMDGVTPMSRACAVGSCTELSVSMEEGRVVCEAEIVLEALSAESYYTVYRDFYDTVIMGRSARDQQSKEMLQIIFATRSYDPGLYWDPSALHGQEGLLRLSQKGTSDIAGMWAGFRDTVEKNMAEVNAWVDAHE
jgi:hypothetical protein